VVGAFESEVEWVTLAIEDDDGAGGDRLRLQNPEMAVGASWEGFVLEQVLRLDQLWVICPGDVRAQRDKGIEACGITALEGASLPP